MRDSVEQLPLSKALTSIKCDVDLPLSLADLVPTPPNVEVLGQYYREFEFKSWLQEVEQPDDAGSAPSAEAAAQVAEVQANYDLILREADLDTWVTRLGSQELIAIDTETTSINYMDAELVGFSFAVALVKAAYLPVAHDYPGAPTQIFFGRGHCRAKTNP